jgi:hypothetical protein
MSDIATAAEIVRDVERQIAAAGAEIERLAGSKRGHALASARGDKKATAAIGAANDAIAAAERRRGDLRIAMEVSRAELATAEREQQLAGDAAQAHLIEQALAELVSANAAVDAGMSAFAKALQARRAAAWQLKSALPRTETVLTYALSDELPVALAMRHHRLAQWLGGGVDASGGQSLAATSPAGAVAQVAARLRGAHPRSQAA